MADLVSKFSWLLLLGLLSTLLRFCHASTTDNAKVYIVYMGDRPDDDYSVSSLHTNMLEDALGSGGSGSLIYSYQRSFNGFAAKLTDEQMQKLAVMEGVVSVFPSEKKHLHTTRSWNFMGLSQQVKRSRVERNVIIAMLDSGIWPDSHSFSDHGFGPPPRKWKGKCQKSSHFTCNNKVIGARYYRSSGALFTGDVASPLDTEGHGSHTASTAAGNVVGNTSLAGFRLGVARGGVPSARIAVYKVCWLDGCYAADILAAFDDAIADGVDIISISVGGDVPRPYFADPISIGAFHAMKHGILTSTSAGNSGPRLGSITNFSPWSLSVAASSIDRTFRTAIKLGNGVVYKGISINTRGLQHKMYPTVYGGNAPNIKKGFKASASRHCLRNSLDRTLVKGKIVVCDSARQAAATAMDAGAVGVIVRGRYFKDGAENFPIPASVLGVTDGTHLFKYIKRTRKPTATIFRSTETKDRNAPHIASFSSRGPNPITSDILKPDLAAPGVDILAAWSKGASVTGVPGDDRVVAYNIISGTSMACPHATGAAAYVKSIHPKWSPAAIKSALMTTASSMTDGRRTDGVLSYGSGHLNPAKARNPGLIYDIEEYDYIKFLCGQEYNDQQLRLVTRGRQSCSKANRTAVWDLNYPSFALSAHYGRTVTRTFHRTVTNIGQAKSRYKVVVRAPKTLHIRVKPEVLSFKSRGEKKSFAVTVTAKMKKGRPAISGTLTWNDGKHQVRSPIVAHVSSKTK
ncbi:hypothetical protein K2173_015016 [Erythroxylum novogranatense]|uniref:Cucumisin n=1 Tax=Erythroxylum novogranatense TaxID=1862640 RepID=A0AAV8TU46_9ROSI|nr:hypothetical protein K2173_015016 [Erythroxylum novogranatense]